MQNIETHGEGATHLAVGDLDGKVILSFPKSVQWVALDQSIAGDIAEAIMRASFAGRPTTKGNDKIKTLVAERLRQKMILRLTHMIRSMSDDGKAYNYIAQQCVDVMLQEFA